MDAQLHRQILKQLDAQLKKVPEQKDNLQAMKRFVANGKDLPNSGKPILYAIGGVAGLAKVEEYGRILQRERSKNPEVLAQTYSFTSQMMSSNKRWVAPPNSSGSSRKPGSSSQPSGRSSNPPVQLAPYGVFNRSRDPEMTFSHDIMIEFRMPQYLGGCGRVVRRTATMNDTGSNVQSLKRSDWNALNTLRKTPDTGMVNTAIGLHTAEHVMMEMRVMTPTSTGTYAPLTVWFVENLRIVDDDDVLLSGEVMRNHLFFATPPGNDHLIVARSRQTLMSLLPA